MNEYNMTAKIVTTKPQKSGIVNGKQFYHNYIKAVDSGGVFLGAFAALSTLYYCNDCGIPFETGQHGVTCPVCGTSNSLVDVSVDKCKELISTLSQKCKSILSSVTQTQEPTVEVVTVDETRASPPVSPRPTLRRRQLRAASLTQQDWDTMLAA